MSKLVDINSLLSFLKKQVKTETSTQVGNVRSEYDKKISSLNSQLTTANNSIKTKDSTITNLNSTINTQKTQLTQKDQTIASLQAQIQSLQAQLKNASTKSVRIHSVTKFDMTTLYTPIELYINNTLIRTFSMPGFPSGYSGSDDIRYYPIEWTGNV